MTIELFIQKPVHSRTRAYTQKADQYAIYQKIKNILINYSRNSRRIKEEEVMNELRGGDDFLLKVENSKTTPIHTSLCGSLIFSSKKRSAFPFRVRENGVLRPLSDRDSTQGKAYVTKVGHGYSFTTRNVPHNGTIHSNMGQGHRALVPIFARNILLGGAILVNCLKK
jgi:hypothetical protein